MKSKLVAMFFVTGMLIACSNSTQQPSASTVIVPDVKAEVEKMNDVLKKYEKPAQTFRISVGKSAIITGKGGTVVYIEPQNLELEDAGTLGNNIDVELKELADQEQLLKANAQTMSDGKLLVSGGAYYINLTSNGKQVRLKSGKTLSVKFPRMVSDEMSLFYGNRDSLGGMNWKDAGQKFRTPKPESPAQAAPAQQSILSEAREIDLIYEHRPLTDEEKKVVESDKANRVVSEKLYKTMELNQFGWINCDRFYDVTDKTDLQYTFTGPDSLTSVRAHLVFRDINSVMGNTSYTLGSKEYQTTFYNIPTGMNVRLIAFSVKNGKTYIYSSDLKIKANERIHLTFKEADEDLVNRTLRLN